MCVCALSRARTHTPVHTHAHTHTTTPPQTRALSRGRTRAWVRNGDGLLSDAPPPARGAVPSLALGERAAAGLLGRRDAGRAARGLAGTRRGLAILLRGPERVTASVELERIGRPWSRAGGQRGEGSPLIVTPPGGRARGSSLRISRHTEHPRHLRSIPCRRRAWLTPGGRRGGGGTCHMPPAPAISRLCHAAPDCPEGHRGAARELQKPKGGSPRS